MKGSKEGQDRFAEIINQGKPGFFLDLGCAHPWDGNNTWRLEQAGWKGFLFDINVHSVNHCRKERVNPTILADLAHFDLAETLWNVNAPMVIDYMSVDIDGGTDAFVEKFEWNHKHRRIRCMTIEHDSYGKNFARKEVIHRALSNTPYRILAEDVRFTDKNGGEHPWEDWWVCEELIPEKLRDLHLKDMKWENVLATMADTLR